jgi:hypothetical protein
MPSIYLSYTHADAELAKKVGGALAERGYTVLIDTAIMNPGEDWRKTLLAALKSADGVVALITENSVKSAYVLSEIGTARAFVDEALNKKFLIPIFYEDVIIPSVIGDLFGVKLNDSNFADAVDQIDGAISKFIGKKEAVEENQSQVKAEIESKAADYVAEAKQELRIRESYNKWAGIICYLAGFLALLGGAASGLYSLRTLATYLDKGPWFYAIGFLKSSVVIGLFIASAKYAFDLGKSFTHESLKNSDRIHAISYGEFYLRAFSDRVAAPEELTSLFQHWNIDNTSSAFLKLDSNNFDPKMMDKMLDTVKAAIDKVKTDK